MPRFRRTDRINEQLKQEISLIVRDEVRDPRVGLATITAVITSPELDHARVYVTSLGDEKEREGIIEGLRSAAAFIRKQLSGRLHMRRVPELHFEADRVLAEASRIEELLRQALPPELRNQPLDADEAGDSAGADDLDDAEDLTDVEDADDADDLTDVEDADDADDLADVDDVDDADDLADVDDADEASGLAGADDADDASGPADADDDADGPSQSASRSE